MVTVNKVVIINLSMDKEEALWLQDHLKSLEEDFTSMRSEQIKQSFISALDVYNLKE